ncbi:hybrid sensor histidine kinase/response regulator [Chondromyces apiculatus]|uniref:histidine kinase n=1 Tax=Chondromyces apiculatus DSM 436 TaxID=1192034 RepID=A0A017TD19_9BACT|nr:response regulator [Chondromyces apiculatus]EYF06822.1 Putative SigmaB asociated two-component system sensor protein [Chondromyces apiculatus DSM 436]
MTQEERAKRFGALSRELELICDHEGCIVFADARAKRLLGAEPGVLLRQLSAPGAEEKVDFLIAESRVRAVSGWELALVVDGTPTTLAVRTSCEGEEIALVASLVPQDYAEALGQVSATMSELAGLYRETERQQRELLRRHEELLRLGRELDDSNRGVVALHAELDEKQDSLRRASEVKARMVANVSHEFRTPLNSILGLSRLLLDRTDGELNEEQDKQLKFIRRAAETLSELVNDLLDLSKMEAGKVGLRIAKFDASDIFVALRGMLRPLAPEGVQLVIEDASALPKLDTDESKVAQVLRNFLSNALKFTERGEVRLRAHEGPSDTIVFSVADTGIGIAPEDQHHVFEEFIQIDSPLQRKVKGTGLGLALCVKIGETLGGSVSLQSTVGKGSTFSLIIPRVHPEAKALDEMVARSERLDPTRAPVLVVEDDRQTLFLYEKYLEGSGFQVVPARSIEDARRAMERVRPSAVVLDIMLEGETSWNFLEELKANEATRDIPALVVTVTNREEKARALGADEFCVKPFERAWLLRRLKALARTGPVERVLVIDDDEVARYLVRRMLSGTPYVVIEAMNGEQGVEVARRERPQVIFLDFLLGDMTAFDVLDELKKDPRTRSIPVIVHTSKSLEEGERERLKKETAAILSKHSLSRELAIARIRDALTNAGIGPAVKAVKEP